MFQTESILDYLQSLTSGFLNGRDADVLNKKISLIRKKKNDPKLYLAVVGEFNSGKSTFINALLGFRLLKEAVKPTTSCATYLQCGASRLSLKTSFFDNKRFLADESNYDSLKNYIESEYDLRITNFFDLITALTSVQNIAKNVKSLFIKIPGNSIPPNIIIIDTPGFNPGSDCFDNHLEITKDVVENVADSAIILTSQEQAMSTSLSGFLKNYLSRCLHRCIYVVTKFDLLENDFSRKEVMEYVYQRINLDLNINNPKLFGISSVTALPVKQIPFDKEKEWPDLKKAFFQFKSQTWSTLQKRLRLCP